VLSNPVKLLLEQSLAIRKSLIWRPYFRGTVVLILLSEDSYQITNHWLGA
jgi:hypothetical protein